MKGKYEHILEDARQRFAENMNHLDFHNRYFGYGSKFMPPTEQEREEYFASGVPREIMKMRDELTDKQPEISFPDEGVPVPGGKEYSGRILVRCAKSLHQALSEEADREGVSLNQLVVAKLAVQLNKATKP